MIPASAKSFFSAWTRRNSNKPRWRAAEAASPRSLRQKTGETDEYEVDGNNVVQQPRDHQNQDARGERDQRLQKTTFTAIVRSIPSGRDLTSVRKSRCDGSAPQLDREFCLLSGMDGRSRDGSNRAYEQQRLPTPDSRRPYFAGERHRRWIPSRSLADRLNRSPSGAVASR
jgi:hypothetical protein